MTIGPISEAKSSLVEYLLSWPGVVMPFGS